LLQEAEYQTQRVLALYRLPPNSSQWQYLGLMPTNENALMYAPAPTAGGVIWTYGGSTLVGNDLSGIIGGTGTSTGVIYTATYPSLPWLKCHSWSLQGSAGFI
jgi:hypothetical protein